MSYATLLEEASFNAQYSNDTFTSIENFIESSLVAVANESVDFDIMINVAEVSLDDVKATGSKVKEAVAKKAKELIAKIAAFVSNIKDALKRVVAKAKATIAVGGNKALLAMTKNAKATVGKDIELKIASKNDMDVLAAPLSSAVSQCLKVATDISSELEKINNAYYANNFVPSMKTVDETIETYKEKYSNATGVNNTIKINKGESVKDAFEEIKKGSKIVADRISSTDKDITATVKACDAAKKSLEKIQKMDGADAETFQAGFKVIATLSTKAMQLGTCSINFSVDVLKMYTKAAAQLALVAVGEDGKRIVKNTKDAAGEKVEGLKVKGNEIKAVAKDKAETAAITAMVAGDKVKDAVKSVGKKKEAEA